MSKTKEEKRKLRNAQKEQAKKLATAKKQAEKNRLENKAAQQSYPQIDPAFIKAVDDLFENEKKDDKKTVDKKKRWGVRISAAALALLVGGSCSFILHRNSKSHNNDPEPTDPIATIDVTGEPDNEPTYVIPTPTSTVKSTMEPSAEVTESLVPSAKPSKKPNRPIATVTPTSNPTLEPTSSPSSEPTDHVHNFLDWFSFDDEKEERECSICGEKEYRDHVYAHSYTVEKDVTSGYHKRIDNRKCINCDHESKTSTLEKCTFGKMTYDKNYEYQECLYCHDIVKTKHNLYSVIEGDYRITKCRHSGCGYNSKEYIGSIDPTDPITWPTAAPTVRPTAQPTAEPTVAPTALPTLEPTVPPVRPTKNLPDDPSEPTESMPSDIEINTPRPTLPPDVEIHTPEPELPIDVEVHRPEQDSDENSLAPDNETNVPVASSTTLSSQHKTQSFIKRKIEVLMDAKKRLEALMAYDPTNKDKSMKIRPIK